MSDFYSAYCAGASAEVPQNQPGSRADEAGPRNPRLDMHSDPFSNRVTNPEQPENDQGETGLGIMRGLALQLIGKELEQRRKYEAWLRGEDDYR